MKHPIIDPTPFHNKIFFCDIIGYSKLPPANQYECHAQLTRIIRTCLEKLNAKLPDDVIALPTGDGLILNYIKPEPDIHLRTALMILEILSKYNEKALLPIKLRIGINTNVDSIVLDVNNKKNIIGKGINLAQRITDLGDHGKVLMHRRVYEDLSNYKKYDGKLTYLGDFTVKHHVVLPLFQYIDYECGYLDNTLLKKTDDHATPLTLRDIRQSRLQESILSIKLKGYDRDYFDDLHAYMEEFLDNIKIFQKTKIAVNWIANEMLDNVFRHGQLHIDDEVYLKLDRVKDGIFISTEQPDISNFNIREIDKNGADCHFLSMLRGRGIQVNVLHTNGRMDISCLLPFDFEIKDLKILAVTPEFSQKERPIDILTHETLELSPSIHYTVLENGIYLISLKNKIYEKEIDIFKNFINQLIKAKYVDIIVDLSRLEHVYSSGIAMFINCHREIRKEGGSMIFVNPHDNVKEIFGIFKLDSIIQIARSIEDALAYFKIFY